MAKAADIGSKRLISLAPDAWVQWVTGQPEVRATEILSPDFQWVSRESDVLLKVFSCQHGDFVIVNEVQLRYTAKMPRRMRAYAALAEERYQLPIYPVLVNILPPSANTEILSQYTSTFLDLQARQDYRVINLWEVDARIVFERSLSSLLPFVPVLRGGSDPAMVQQAVQLLRRDEQLSELETLLAFFASFVMGTELVAQIMRWDMTVLRESPWYEEILKEGEKRGLQQGLQQERVLILKLLARKIGTVPAELQLQIENLTVPELEELGESLLDFTQLEDLVTWLERARAGDQLI